MQQIHIRNSMIVIIFMSLLFTSCKKEVIDTEYPVIHTNASDAFPRNCSEIVRGQNFTATIVVSDNQELGSLSVEIHHNFEHHSHSTEINECELSPIKIPINPFARIEAIAIPNGRREYTAIKEIPIPTDIDAGDYHFLIRLTDKEGWQSIKGLSIKII